MIIVDVETTGIDPREYSLVSIGAVDFENPLNTFYGECRVWDGALVSEESLEINGFTEAEVRDPNKKPFEQLMREFKEWVDGCEERTFAGQNPAFDRDFINNGFLRAGIEYRIAVRTVDLHSLAYTEYRRKGIPVPPKNGHSDLSLNEIAKYVGLSEEPKPHNALTGAKFEAEAFSRLIYGKNLLPEFAEYPMI